MRFVQRCIQRFIDANESLEHRLKAESPLYAMSDNNVTFAWTPSMKIDVLHFEYCVKP